jgi:hypothetical protein
MMDWETIIGVMLNHPSMQSGKDNEKQFRLETFPPALS